MDFWLKITSDVIKLAEPLQLTDNDLTRLLARYRHRDSTFACGVSALVQEIVTHRRLLDLAAEMKPGETLTSLSDLVLRRKKRVESGEN